VPIPKIGTYVLAGGAAGGFVTDVTRSRLISRNCEHENVIRAAVVESGGMLAPEIARRNLRRALQNAAHMPVEESRCSTGRPSEQRPWKADGQRGWGRASVGSTCLSRRKKSLSVVRISVLSAPSAWR
jgi:hypothetical protein